MVFGVDSRLLMTRSPKPTMDSLIALGDVDAWLVVWVRAARYCSTV
jgi:hypothetical protein